MRPLVLLDALDSELERIGGGIITTIVKTIAAAHSRRPAPELKAGAPPAGSEEIELLREVIDQVSGRVAHLEEERDFYKELLEAPRARDAIRLPESQ